jgi:hypothetical protein
VVGEIVCDDAAGAVGCPARSELVEAFVRAVTSASIAVALNRSRPTLLE